MLVSPSRRISYTRLDAALKDEAEKLYVSAAPSLSPHPSVSNYLTVDLAVLKELSQEFARLFNLTLPVAIKQQTRFRAHP